VNNPSIEMNEPLLEESEHLSESSSPTSAAEPTFLAHTTMTPSIVSSRSQSSSSTTNTALSPRALSCMREQFSSGFNRYSGPSWTLPSGTNMDDSLYSYIYSLESEYSLHSFIIDHLDPVLDSLSKNDDKEALVSIMTESDSQRNNFELPEWMAYEMNRFKRDPGELLDILSKGWAELSTTNIHQGVPLNVLKLFRSNVYTAFLHLYTIYSNHNFDLSATFYEGFYRTLIWGFLHILIFDKKLTYDTGEVSSTASSDRKNVKRYSTAKTKKQGRKIDGVIYCRANKKELCAIEFGRFDHGPAGTKVLNDGMKLAK
ncbi:hypothetical protein BGZ76_005142, partial [Entomortierella beljakovae]